MVAAGSVRWFGQEDQRLARLRVLEADAAQVFGIVPAGLDAGQSNGLVADDAIRPVGRCGVEAPRIHVGLGTGDEEGISLMQDMQPREVDPRFREGKLRRDP
jgi:hypothetical protein